jgi:predicted acetyltransferase
MNYRKEMNTEFKFLEVGPLADGDLRVVLSKTTPADPVKKYVPGYEFEMREGSNEVRAGTIRLRIGRTRPLLGWCGHIGYHVDEKSRGKRYAARSCRLVFPIAFAHGLRTIWITCDPKNIASRRTCELAGGQYVNTVTVPRGTEAYAQGRRRVRRYRFDLKKMMSKPSEGTR